jgi:hypothetical protein
VKSKGKSLLGAAGIGLQRKTPEATDQLDTTDALAQPSAAEIAPQEKPVEPRPPATVPALARNPSHAMGQTDATDSIRPRRHSRNTAAPIASGAIRMQTVYVTPDDQDRATDAAVRLKKTRQIRGQIGFSLAVRIGLRLLEEKLIEDERAVLAIARDLVSHSGR